MRRFLMFLHGKKLAARPITQPKFKEQIPRYEEGEDAHTTADLASRLVVSRLPSLSDSPLISRVTFFIGGAVWGWVLLVQPSTRFTDNLSHPVSILPSRMYPPSCLPLPVNDLIKSMYCMCTCMSIYWSKAFTVAIIDRLVTSQHYIRSWGFSIKKGRLRIICHLVGRFKYTK